MKKLTFLVLAGLMALGLGDVVQQTLHPQAPPTVTAWAKLKELFH